MNRNDSLTAGTGKTSIRAALIGAVISAAMAVALPQLLHMFGMVTGLGPMPGETFLPMHLPVMLCGFFAGPAAGLISGAASPAISAALTGMPAPAMLPFMTIELAVYGLSAGLIKNTLGTDKHMILKVLAVQASGRAVRAIAILLAFYVLGLKMIAPAVIWNSIIAGLPGIAIQLIVIPAAVYTVNRAGKADSGR